MVTLETNSERTNGITMVRVTVTNTRSTPQTVRLQLLLDGPVWPPRHDGLVDPHWNDDDRWEATVRPGRCRGIGFASPAEPTDPLVEVVSSERHEGEKTRPAAVLGELDRWQPTNEVLEHER
ncbi:hypothetical protein [Natrinema longum]|uniref:Uncharacterized protein n=1 Tax=Natrinema longum TaxID=370324 RepID=A0A8A2U8V9_9EURY|nr:hypothetical protein [Natrinema longum]MBZ6493611.1 hypothetical protein [Natrinema longum]QSW85046.1 hypothetical protein J0X27_16610 [Natrinema longum]